MTSFGGKSQRELSFADRELVELGMQVNVEVVCSKDGRIFDEDLDQGDGLRFLLQ